MPDGTSIGDDIIYGLDGIAKEIGATRRKTHYLSSLGTIPTFKLGRQVCASRRALRSHFAALQAGASPDKAA